MRRVNGSIILSFGKGFNIIGNFFHGNVVQQKVQEPEKDNLSYDENLLYCSHFCEAFNLAQFQSCWKKC